MQPVVARFYVLFWIGIFFFTQALEGIEASLQPHPEWKLHHSVFMAQAHLDKCTIALPLYPPIPGINSSAYTRSLLPLEKWLRSQTTYVQILGCQFMRVFSCESDFFPLL